MESFLLKAFIAIVALIIIIYLSKFSKRNYLIKNGIPGTAKIKLIEKTGMDLGYLPLMMVVFEIPDDEMGIREVVKRQTFDQDDFQPKTGDTVNILIDPKDWNNIIIAPDQTKPNT